MTRSCGEGQVREAQHLLMCMKAFESAPPSCCFLICMGCRYRVKSRSTATASPNENARLPLRSHIKICNSGTVSSASPLRRAEHRVSRPSRILSWHLLGHSSQLIVSSRCDFWSTERLLRTFVLGVPASGQAQPDDSSFSWIRNQTARNANIGVLAGSRSQSCLGYPRVSPIPPPSRAWCSNGRNIPDSGPRPGCPRLSSLPGL